MKKFTVILLASILAGSAMAIDFSPSMIASDAKWVMHSNTERGRATQFGKFIFGEMKKATT